jgi:predicted transcriptional regulator
MNDIPVSPMRSAHKDIQVSFRATPELTTALDTLAAKASRTRSDFIRLSLEAEVDRQRKAGNL